MIFQTFDLMGEFNHFPAYLHHSLSSSTFNKCLAVSSVEKWVSCALRRSLIFLNPSDSSLVLFLLVLLISLSSCHSLSCPTAQCNWLDGSFRSDNWCWHASFNSSSPGANIISCGSPRSHRLILAPVKRSECQLILKALSCGSFQTFSPNL